jgi:hypothetical protein
MQVAIIIAVIIAIIIVVIIVVIVLTTVVANTASTPVAGVLGVAFEANPNHLFANYFKIPRGVAMIQALDHDVFVLAPPWSNCTNYTASIKYMMKQLADDPGVVMTSPRLHIGEQRRVDLLSSMPANRRAPPPLILPPPLDSAGQLCGVGHARVFLWRRAKQVIAGRGRGGGKRWWWLWRWRVCRHEGGVVVAADASSRAVSTAPCST